MGRAQWKNGFRGVMACLLRGVGLERRASVGQPFAERAPYQAGRGGKPRTRLQRGGQRRARCPLRLAGEAMVGKESRDECIARAQRVDRRDQVRKLSKPVVYHRKPERPTRLA